MRHLVELELNSQSVPYHPINDFMLFFFVYSTLSLSGSELRKKATAAAVNKYPQTGHGAILTN